MTDTTSTGLVSPKQIILYNAQILTMNGQRRVFARGSITVEGDRIKAIGRWDGMTPEKRPGCEIIDLQGKWVLPGLINTHVHQSQQLARGLADDVDLLTWLRDRIWPYESSMDEEDSYVSSLMCGMEQIRSGVTAFAEAGGQHVNGMGRAVTELGLRARLAQSSMDVGEGLPDGWVKSADRVLEEQIGHFERWHGQADGRIDVWFGLRTIFNNSDELILRTKELADRYGTGIHMHVAEARSEVEFARQTRGATTVTHLNRLGVLDGNLLAVHTVWLTDDEIGMFADHDVKVSHNPASAMRVLGFAKIPEMRAAGVCVGLGTDGAPTNNRMTLIDDMWVASLIHKGRLLDSTAMPAEDVLEMATCDGARALLWDHEIGSLEAGKKADLIIVDPNTITMLPMHDAVANLVSSMRAENVQSVMVDGRWLMRERVLLTVDEQAIIREASERAAALARRAGITLPQRFLRVD